jgi:hypothetical protein
MLSSRSDQDAQEGDRRAREVRREPYLREDGLFAVTSPHWEVRFNLMKLGRAGLERGHPSSRADDLLGVEPPEQIQRDDVSHLFDHLRP